MTAGTAWVAWVLRGCGSTRSVEDYGPAYHERLGGLELAVARGTPHRLRAKTPEPASPLGEGKNWATFGGLPGVGGVHLVFGEVGGVDGVVVGEEFELGAVGAGGVDALDDADSGVDEDLDDGAIDE